MSHAVLVPREKGQCGQQADRAGDPNQGRSPQSPTAWQCHPSRLQRGKGCHFLAGLVPSSPDEHPCLVQERKSSPGRPHGGRLGQWAPVHPHQALHPWACRNQARNSLKALGPSSSPGMVGLPQPPFSTAGAKYMGTACSLPWDVPPKSIHSQTEVRDPRDFALHPGHVLAGRAGS